MSRIRYMIQNCQPRTDIPAARRTFFAAVTGLIIGFLYAAGKPLDTQDSLDLLDKGFYLQWLLSGIISTVLVIFLWEAASRISARFQRGISRGMERPMFCYHAFYTVLLLLCWLPAFLSIFPGVFSYDAYAEWMQVKTGAITSHHPVVHVLLTGGLMEAFHRLTGNYNSGIAAYTLLQMFVTANILSLTVCYMGQKGIGRTGRLLTLFFYGFSPVIQLFAICTTKDVLFSAFELLFFLLVIQLTREPSHFFESKKLQIGFVLAAFCTMIFRNNGLYIVLLMLPLLAFQYRKYLKKLFLLIAGILLLYGLYRGPVYAVLSVTPGGVEEMLSVPIQQMARVYHYDYDSLNPEDLDLLYQILPHENLDSYKSTVADPVKSGFCQEGFSAHRKEFIRLWIQWGIEHPLTYINSFLIGTVDYWYPGAVVDGYKDSYGKSSYFDYRVAEPGEENVLLPKLHRFYETISWDKKAQQFPLAFLVLSPGWYLLVFFTIFMYLWCYRKKRLLLPLMILLLSVATVLLGPIALVRYVLILFYAFPVLIALFFRTELF